MTMQLEAQDLVPVMQHPKPYLGAPQNPHKWGPPTPVSQQEVSQIRKVLQPNLPPPVPLAHAKTEHAMSMPPHNPAAISMPPQKMSNPVPPQKMSNPVQQMASNPHAHIGDSPVAMGHTQNYQQLTTSKAPAAPAAPAAHAQNVNLSANDRMLHNARTTMHQHSGNMGKKLLGGAALAGGLYALWNANRNANQHYNMGQQYMQQRAEDINTPYPNFYQKFSSAEILEDLKEQINIQEKVAFIKPLFKSAGLIEKKTEDPMPFYYQKFSEYTGQGLFGNIQKSMGDAISQELAKRLVGEPIDKVHGLLKKQLMDEPQYEHVFNLAISSDPDLQQTDPNVLKTSFNTLKKFAPSLAKDPNTTKSFLTQAMTTNGKIDYATIRTLAETEKFVQNAKGKGQQ